MHPGINSLEISKVYACVFRPVKSPMRTLRIFHSSSSLSICADERKRSSRSTCFDLPRVCSFGNNVL